MEGLLKVCNNRLGELVPDHESQLLYFQDFESQLLGTVIIKLYTPIIE